MSVIEFLRNLTFFIFISIGVITVWDYLRNRDETRLKIALWSGTIMVYLIIGIISPFTPNPFLVTRIGIGILLLYPYFLLLVVDLFHTVPRLFLQTILVSCVVCAILVPLSPPQIPPLLTLYFITYFVIVHIYTAYVFVRGAFVKQGLVRRRMQLAALATGILATSFSLSLLAFFVPALAGNFTLLQQVMGGLAGVFYFLAFAAPRSLRRLWQFAELYHFLSEARALSHEQRVAQASGMLRQSATQVTHGLDAILLNFDPTNQKVQFSIGEAEKPKSVEEYVTTVSPALQSAVLQYASTLTTIKDELSNSERELLDTLGVDVVYYVPVRAIEGLQGVLAVFLRDYPLFPEDDLNVLQLFAEQYGLMMEYGYHILEKDRVIEEMVDYTDVLKLRHENERQRFFSVSQNLLAVVDNQHRFILLNPAWERTLGYTQNELTNVTLEELVHPADRETMLLQLRKLEKGEDVSGYEARMVTKEGDLRWFSWWISTLPDHGTFYVAAHNITSIKEAEAEMQALNDALFREQERLNQVISSVPGVVWESAGNPLDSSYQVYFVSDYIEQMTGYTVEETKVPGFWVNMLHPDDRESAIREVNELMERGGQGSIEFRWITKDEQAIWCLSRISVIMDDTGKARARSGVTIDITPTKEAEFARARLAAIVESSQDAIIGHTVDGIITSWNDGAERMYGYTAQEIEGQPITRLWYQPAPDGLDNLRTVLLQGEYFEHPDSQHVRKDGSRVAVSFTTSPVRNSAGNVIDASTIVHDITSIKAAEAELEALNTQLFDERERLQHVISTVPGIVWEARGHPLDKTYRMNFVSDYVEQMLGYTVEETYAMPNFWYNTMHPDDRDQVVDEIEAFMERGGQTSIEFRSVTKDGRVIWCLSHMTVIVDDEGQPIGRRGLAIDITPMKEAGEQLQILNTQLLHEKERLKQVMDNVPGVVWETYGSRQDNSFRPEFISDYMEQMLGYTPTEAQANPQFWYDIIHPDDRESVFERMREIEQNGGQGTVEYRWITKHGQPISCLTRVSIIYDEKGNSIGRSGVTIDVTPIKEAEQARARLAAIVESSQDAIIGHTVEGIITSWNAGAAEMYGYTLDEIIGQSIEKLWYHPPADKLTSLQDALLAGQYFERSDTRHIRKDGTIFAVSFTTSSVRDSAGQVIGASTIAHDITHQKQAEEELRNYAAKLMQSNKSLEEFAYIASHDLQEPLRKIQAFGDRLVTRYTMVLDETGQDYLRRMNDAAGRMRNLINDLLTFSRLTSHPKNFEKVDLNVVLKSVVSDLERRLQETQGKIIIGELPYLDADRSQMYQLFQNLLSNSLKYCREGVKPVIEISGEHITFAPGVEPSYRITVKDNGIGFENKYSEKIFDLFERLHSRTDYEGTGIGLAICRKIVEQHNGTISAEGKPDEGATFTIVLPLKHKGLSTYV